MWPMHDWQTTAGDVAAPAYVDGFGAPHPVQFIRIGQDRMFAVIPAKAGTRRLGHVRISEHWSPAFAGMTGNMRSCTTRMNWTGWAAPHPLTWTGAATSPAVC